MVHPPYLHQHTDVPAVFVMLYLEDSTFWHAGVTLFNPHLVSLEENSSEWIFPMVWTQSTHSESNRTLLNVWTRISWTAKRSWSCQGIVILEMNFNTGLMLPKKVHELVTLIFEYCSCSHTLNWVTLAHLGKLSSLPVLRTLVWYVFMSGPVMKPRVQCQPPYVLEFMSWAVAKPWTKMSTSTKDNQKPPQDTTNNACHKTQNTHPGKHWIVQLSAHWHFLVLYTQGRENEWRRRWVRKRVFSVEFWGKRAPVLQANLEDLHFLNMWYEYQIVQSLKNKIIIGNIFV